MALISKKSNLSRRKYHCHLFKHDNLGSATILVLLHSIQEKENEFKAILNLVEKYNIKKETIVFYADDHGMARGNYGLKSGLMLPLWLGGLGNIQPGRSNALVSFADFLPYCFGFG